MSKSQMFYGTGKLHHQLPYGWCFDRHTGQPMKYVEEQKIIGLILAMHRDGLRCQSIVNVLRDCRSRHDKPWSWMQVKRIIDRGESNEPVLTTGRKYV